MTTDHAVTTFDRNANKYKCCCGIFDVKTGALIVAIVSSIQMTLFFMSVTLFAASSYLLYDIFTFFTWTFAIVCLFYSIWTERAVYCAPYLISGVLGISIAIVIIVLAILAIADPSSSARDFVITLTEVDPANKDIDVRKTAAKLIAWVITMEILELYFIWIVYKCYILFRDQKQLSPTVIPTVQYTQGRIIVEHNEDMSSGPPSQGGPPADGQVMTEVGLYTLQHTNGQRPPVLRGRLRWQWNRYELLDECQSIGVYVVKKSTVA